MKNVRLIEVGTYSDFNASETKEKHNIIRKYYNYYWIFINLGTCVRNSAEYKMQFKIEYLMGGFNLKKNYFV